MACYGLLSKQAKAQNRQNYAMFITGIILVIIGIVAIFGLDPLVKGFIISELVLKPDGYTFKLWNHPPADVNFEIYFLNITNPEQAALGLEKPNLVNQGPYIFRELRRKLNVTFHGNGTLSFYEPVFYFWSPELSRGNKLTDKVTQLDLVVAGMSHQFSHCTENNTAGCINPFLTKTILPSLGLFDITHELFTVQRRSIFKTYTVNDLLFNGYVDPFLVKFKPIAKMAGQRLPARVGLFYGRNGSATGVYTIDTGERDIRNYQMVTHFRGQSIQTVWSSPFANRIYGTIGNAFRPFIKEGEKIHAFAGDICRVGELVFDRKGVVDGVTTFVMVPPHDESVAPWPQNENARGFCVPDTNNCPPDGLMDETPCLKEPSFMGKPHFYDADPRLLSVFTGLKPDPVEHETEMQIDPYTGAIIEVDKRLMICFPVRKSFITEAGNINLASNVRDGVTTIFPMFWVNETAKVRKVVFDQITYQVYPAMAFAQVTPYVILATAISLLIASTIRLVIWRRQNNNEKDMPSTDPVNFDKAGYNCNVQQVIVNCSNNNNRRDNNLQHQTETLQPFLSSSTTKPNC